MQGVDMEWDSTRNTGKQSGISVPRPFRTAVFCSALALIATGTVPNEAGADEGGVSFWIPGLFGSLAATPQQRGWSFASIYYHTSVSAGADVAFARQP